MDASLNFLVDDSEVDAVVVNLIDVVVDDVVDEDVNDEIESYDAD